MSQSEAYALSDEFGDKGCSQCTHWHALNAGIGECRCNPPIVCQRDPVPSSEVPVRPWFFGQYPITRRDDWCGAFAVRG